MNHQPRWIVRINRLAGLMALIIGLAGRGISPAAAQDSATFQPPTVTGVLCEAQCLDQPITITLPPIAAPQPQSLDLAFVMDITGSMSDELSSMVGSSREIVQVLQARVPDLRVAFATYQDYDGGILASSYGDPGDLPYRLVSDFTTDADGFRGRLSGLSTDGGGDTAESSLRALWEIAQLAWRADAQRIVVHFTDAPAHDPDPGRDEREGTPDDLTAGIVHDALNAAGIVTLNVQSGSDGSARSFLNALASATGGRRFDLADAADIPTLIVTEVGAELDRTQLSFGLDGASFSSVSLTSAGFSQTPSAFPYPADGSPVTVNVRLCPAALGLASGQYTADLPLARGTTRFGSVPVSFRYSETCTDAFVADNAADAGVECSQPPYWNSPAIRVQHTPDTPSPAGDSLPPRTDADNFVYVQASNRGLNPIAALRVSLQAGAVGLPLTAADWTAVGEQTVPLAASETRWVGPFVWRTAQVAPLRALLDAPEDPLDAAVGIACDNNQAVLNRVPVTLDSATLGVQGGMGGGTLLRLPASAGATSLTSLNPPAGVLDARLSLADSSIVRVTAGLPGGVTSAVGHVQIVADSGDIGAALLLTAASNPNAQITGGLPQDAPVAPAVWIVAGVLVIILIVLGVLAWRGGRRRAVAQETWFGG